MVTIFERSMTTTVNDIEHIESQSYSAASRSSAFISSRTSRSIWRWRRSPPFRRHCCASSRRELPRPTSSNTTPPACPSCNWAWKAKLSANRIFSICGLNFIRTQLATVQGAAVPLPYGGKFRQIMVDLNPDQLYAKGISATDVSNAVSAQSIILPAGDAKIGKIDYQIKVNSSPKVLRPIERPADPGGQWRDGVHQGCGAGARRVCGANQHRAHQRHARHADDRAAQRPGFHAVDRERGESPASADPGRTASRSCTSASCSISRCSCARLSTAWCARP